MQTYSFNDMVIQNNQGKYWIIGIGESTNSLPNETLLDCHTEMYNER